MKLCFDSIEEVKEFVTQLKGTRGKKGEADDAPASNAGTAPAPMQPPAGGAAQGFPGASTGFAPPAAGAGMSGGFPAVAVPAVDPAISALVQRITTCVEAAVQAGTTKPHAMLSWFRSQCGAEAANATWDQIKDNFLPKMAMPQLESLAKMLNA